MDENLLYKIALALTPGVGPVLAKNLVSYTGSPEAVFEARKKELLAIPGIGDQTAKAIRESKALERAAEELNFLEKYEVQVLFYTDKTYPRRLQQYPDAPVLLFYKGKADLNTSRTLGIVGTRKPDAYGTWICEQIIEDLQAFSPLIISGLAYGIDIAAHKKALNLGLQTVGCLGHGLAKIYPPGHQATATKMITQGGLITEYASWYGPDKDHFPMRNRIIAGLCDAVVVIQTAERGGSMITAEIANTYHKDVFAVPGRPKDLLFAGCNKLLKRHKATLVERGADIANHLRWDVDATHKARQRSLWVELSELEKGIIELIRKEDKVAIDQLSFNFEISPSKMAAVLLELEFKGLIQSVPGQQFVLTM